MCWGSPRSPPPTTSCTCCSRAALWPSACFPIATAATSEATPRTAVSSGTRLRAHPSRANARSRFRQWRPSRSAAAVRKVVGDPPLSELSDLERREFQDALLEAASFRGSAWEVEGGDRGGRAESPEVAGRQGG